MLKDSKRSFVVVLVVVGVWWKHDQKMFHNERKMFALKISPTFKESDETIGSYAALYDVARPRGTYCGLVWYFMVLYGLFVVFFGKILISLDLNNLFSRKYIQIHLIVLSQQYLIG